MKIIGIETEIFYKEKSYWRDHNLITGKIMWKNFQGNQMDNWVELETEYQKLKNK